MRINVQLFKIFLISLIGFSTIPTVPSSLHSQGITSILENKVPTTAPLKKSTVEDGTAPKPQASLDIMKNIPADDATGPRDPLEPYRWNVQMAEMSFGINNDARSYGKLLSARIHLIEAACLKPLLTKSDVPPTKICVDTRDLVLSEFPNTPAAVCARDGIDSSTCKEAHSKLPIEDFRNYQTATEKAENDFIGIVDPKEAIDAASSELIKMHDTQQDPSKERDKEKEDNFKTKMLLASAKLLKLACSEENYAILPLSRNRNTKKAKIEVLKMQRPTPPIVRAVATKTPSADTKPDKFTPAGFELIRLKDKQCSEQVNTVMYRLPNAASLTCAQNGRYSPICLNAIKAEDELYRKTKKPIAGKSQDRPLDPKQKIFKSF